MKDEKSKYLIIDAVNVNKEKQINGIKQIINAKEMFEKYNVPREYQKVIVKLNNPLFSKYDATEYIIGFPFDLTAGTVIKENDKNYLIASNPSTCDYTKKDFGKVTFKTEVKYNSFEEVMPLLIEMDEKNYLFSYFKFINEFFGKNVNIDLLEQLYNETNKNSKKTLRLYKKQTKSKNI